jgi:hypothetical protein
VALVELSKQRMGRVVASWPAGCLAQIEWTDGTVSCCMFTSMFHPAYKGHPNVNGVPGTHSSCTAGAAADPGGYNSQQLPVLCCYATPLSNQPASSPYALEHPCVSCARTPQVIRPCSSSSWQETEAAWQSVYSRSERQLVGRQYLLLPRRHGGIPSGHSTRCVSFITTLLLCRCCCVALVAVVHLQRVFGYFKSFFTIQV